MSDTSEAGIQRLREEAPVLESVCTQIERLVEPTEAPLVVRFAELLFSKAPPELLHDRGTDALAHMALGTFRFLERSRPHRVDVEVFNPDVDNEGWYAPVTVLRTDISERPFVVDTIREYLHARSMSIEHYVYPVLHVERDPEGSVVDVRASHEGEGRESLVHCEVSRITDPGELDRIRTEVARRLQDVVRATTDFDPMVDALNDTVAALEERAQRIPERRKELREIQAFLRWLRDGAFVFLGYRGYDLVETPDGERSIVVEPGSGLGILRNEAESAYAEPSPLSGLPRELRELVEGGPVLIISKTNAESTVHRRARMDYIGVKKLDDDGEVVGERRFIGLFTSKAFQEEADHIPILRDKLRQILEEAGVQEGSHDYKEINTIFNSMPKEELFLTSAEEIGAEVHTILTTHHTHEVRVTLREDPLQRGVSAMVILPKERFSGEVRKQLEDAMAERYGAEILNYHLALGEGDQARLHFYLGLSRDQLDVIDAEELEDLVRELIRSWSDRVRERLEQVRPPDDARRLAELYGDGFSPEYQAANPTGTAVQDILELEAMAAEERRVSISFSNPEESPPAAGEERITELKLYLRGERLVLSDFMPILENCGLRIIAVTPYEVRGRGVTESVLYAFAVQDQERRPLELDERIDLLGEAILAVRAGDATNDGLNALVVLGGLHWREVAVLRAYASYAFQLGAVPSRLSLPSALVKHPEIARTLFEHFSRRFDPAAEAGSREERKRSVREIRERFGDLLAEVGLLSDDRALRRLAALLEGTVRTNYFQTGGRHPAVRSGGVPYVSFKFACKELESIARSRLLYEVWVRSPRMEGVHLRGAKVARGGIRWSDRPDDFRTEVLGLVKTQMIKNAVIVPAGSKGGFVTLRHLQESEQMAQEAEDQYCTLMRGLLDLTDNLVEGEPVSPVGVVCWDPPDPYLVVAADKGTARFSDVANEVAAEYDFWLDDAFASGGSQGYDHKEVGITARGAWECVKRHFREIGKDIQSEPFTVVGIGDMSGDVFGNGMLLSRQIRLIAAFDHRHVFIDPDPDPASSYEERERLFRMGRSSWDDYDRERLSPGGMIVPRGVKRVELTPEARAALGISSEEDVLDGETLIRRVLAAPVELLWNGGIGTYVKSSGESHADVGDAANDAVRVDAPDLRCRVVGEGGNLGFTQLGRIEYALGGGRLNTDAIDNSGGVDLSDREVNLKILLNPAVQDGDMEIEERNRLLEELTEEVSELVLRDNDSQSLAVSLDEIRVGEALDDFRDLMSTLEKRGVLDRTSEHLPTWEGLVERLEEEKSLTRPELCVLLAYAKLDLMSGLLSSPLPDEPATVSYLLGYFPPQAVQVAGEERLERHRLHREIIASQLVNDTVDLMGSTFVHRVARDTGRAPHEVVRAWLIAARLAGHRQLVRRLREQQELEPDVSYRWLLGLSRVLERTTRWILVNVDADDPTTTVIEENLSGLGSLRDHFEEVVSGDDRELFRKRVAELREVGATEEFARSLITLRFLDQLLEILRVARETGSDPVAAARAYYRISELLHVPWLREAVFRAAGDDRWEQRAAQSLGDDLHRAHRRLAAWVARHDGKEATDTEATDRLVRHRLREVRRFQEILDEIRGEEEANLSALSVAVRAASHLAERAESTAS